MKICRNKDLMTITDPNELEAYLNYIMDHLTPEQRKAVINILEKEQKVEKSDAIILELHAE